MTHNMELQQSWEGRYLYDFLCILFVQIRKNDIPFNKYPAMYYFRPETNIELDVIFIFANRSISLMFPLEIFNYAYIRPTFVWA